MFSLFVLVHVISALFLGSFLAFPLVINTVFSRTGDELKAMLKMILSFTRSGHYALVLLIISGCWMVVEYSAYPSIVWVGIAVLLFVLIGGLIGMIHKNIKIIIDAENPEKKLLENVSKLKLFGWITFFFIMTTVFIMTNRNLFS